MSKLAAIQGGNPLETLQVIGEIDMTDVEAAMIRKDAFDVPVLLPDDDDAIGLVAVYDLRRELDGWGVEYLCGFVIENSRMIPVRLLDEAQAVRPLKSSSK